MQSIKKITFLILIVLLSNTNTFSSTTVPGGSVSGTWTKIGSPYNIMGHIQIDSNSILNIEPGVLINFQGQFRLKVQGRILAIGNQNDFIHFFSTDTITGWRGIRFEGIPLTNDSSKFVYCKIENVNTYSLSITEYTGSIYIKNFSKFVIKQCVFTKNKVHDGGGIGLDNVHGGIIQNNKIYNNIATSISGAAGKGGGIYADIENYIFATNYLLISHNFITNNIASSHGGGIYVTMNNISYQSVFINNNIITNNTCIGSGGGCRFDGSSSSANSNPLGIEFVNNTVANNQAANGGGFSFFQAVRVNIRNSIIYGNLASNSGNQISLSSENTDPNFFNCNIQNGAIGFYLSTGTYTGTYTNNISVNPQFMIPSIGTGKNFDGLNANWQLLYTSACRDIGIMNIIHEKFDIAGNPRVTPCIVDLGAYELQYNPPFSILNIDTSVRKSACIGDSIKLRINDTTGLIYFQWKKDGINIMGANSNEYFAKEDGNYTLYVIGNTNCTKTTDTVLLRFTPNAKITSGSKTTICEGNYVVLHGNIYEGLNYQWKLNGINIPGAIDSIYLATDSGKYSLETYRLGACHTVSNTISVDYFPKLNIEINPNKFNICRGDTVFILANFYPNVSYNWYRNDTLMPNEVSQELKTSKVGQYFVTVTDTNLCKHISNKTNINIYNIPFNDEKICAVTIDSLSGYNKVSWSKTPNVRIKNYNIYRESQFAGQFDLIRTINYNSPNEFIDSNSTPHTKNYIYSISIIDSCGFESNKSVIHKTMLLTASTNGNTVNLIWSNYEGLQFSNIEIQRSINGSSFNTIATISKSNQIYIDNVNISGLKKYRLMITNTNCNQINVPSVYSNIVSISSTGINFNLNDAIKIFPNPTSDEIVIYGNTLASNELIYLYDISGKEVLKIKPNNENKIDLSIINSGVYYLKINFKYYKILKL